MEKRSAGQHALNEGRKRKRAWTLAEAGASILGLKGAKRFARKKARSAEQTWTTGGMAEEKVGVALETLREHGFYLFHDIELPGLGNVDHAALGLHGFFCIETKSHGGKVVAKNGKLLLNGREPNKDFVSQTWRGSRRLEEILGAEVVPLLCFTNAFVEGRVYVRGVRVLPLRWLTEEILRRETRYGRQEVKAAVGDLGQATGCYPSAVPSSPSRRA